MLTESLLFLNGVTMPRYSSKSPMLTSFQVSELSQWLDSCIDDHAHNLDNDRMDRLDVLDRGYREAFDYVRMHIRSLEVPTLRVSPDLPDPKPILATKATTSTD